MTVAIKPLHEITVEAIQILCREMGLVNTIRFINQFSAGYGNYTEERDPLFAEMSFEEIVAQIKQQKKIATHSPNLPLGYT